MRKLTVVGMGPGSQSCLTLEALEALRKADLIVGAGRLLETLPEGCSKNRKIAVSAQAVCDAVYGSDSSFPCVVCTGDTGCYSLCTGLGKYWDGELSILPPDRKYVLFGCETAAAVAGLESGECPRKSL